MVTANDKAVPYKIGQWLRKLRRGSNQEFKKILPQGLKNMFIDLEWSLYRTLTPHLVREVARPSRPIVVISTPKGGTHVLKSILLLLPGTRFRGFIPAPGVVSPFETPAILALCNEWMRTAKPGYVYLSHLPYRRELATWLDQKRIKRIFIFRDPRAYTVSLHHYIMKMPFHPWHRMFRALKNDDERLLGSIRGIGGNSTHESLSPTAVPNVKVMFRQFLGWLTDAHTFCLRFEDLIDGSSKASDRFANTITEMLTYLETLKCPLSRQAMLEIRSEGLNPRKSDTFRMGDVGGWRKEYKVEHWTAFQEVAGDLLLDLGYEENLKRDHALANHGEKKDSVKHSWH